MDKKGSQFDFPSSMMEQAVIFERNKENCRALFLSPIELFRLKNFRYSIIPARSKGALRRIRSSYCLR